MISFVMTFKTRVKETKLSRLFCLNKKRLPSVCLEVFEDQYEAKFPQLSFNGVK